MNSNRITQSAQTLHDTAGDVLAYSAPILAPIPSALAIYSILAHDNGWLTAFVTAVAVEGLGFAVTSQLLRVWNEKGFGRWMRLITAAMSAVYLLVVFLILATTKGVEAYQMAFPALTLVGASCYAIHQEITRRDTAVLREIDVKAYKRKSLAEAQAYERKLSAEVSAVSTETDRRTAQPAATSGGQATPDDLRRYLVDNPQASVRQAAAALGMSKSWVQTWKGKATQ